MDEYEMHCAENHGYCTSCKAWDDDFYEPDARERTCPNCGEPTLYGAEECAIMELEHALFGEGEDE